MRRRSSRSTATISRLWFPKTSFELQEMDVAVIAQQEKSGKPVRVFCREHGAGEIHLSVVD
jgi:hypothetical protein